MKLYDFAPWNTFIRNHGIRNLYIQVGEDDRLLLMNHEKDKPFMINTFENVEAAIDYVRKRKGWLR